MDILVLKLNSSGIYQWHTFLGSGYEEQLTSLVVKGTDLYASGWGVSNWNDFTPVNSHPLNGIYSAPWAAKFNASTGALTYYTFRSSTTYDRYPSYITVDGSNAIYWGVTTQLGGSVVKLNTNFTVASAFNLGQSVHAIFVDSGNNLYVSGLSTLTWGSPIRNHSYANDGFFDSYDLSGNLLWHTFLYAAGGGAFYDGTFKGIISSNDNIYYSFLYSSGSSVSPLELTQPTVTNVTSSNTDGIYYTGDTISIKVTFSENVYATGTPLLELDTNAVNQTAVYVSGSGTDTLTFNYVVPEGVLSSDLDYISASSLILNGETITDTNYNNAILTLPAPGAAGSLSNNKQISVNASQIVTKTTDTNDGICDSDCSLREAITASNINGAGLDAIAFNDNYTITLGSRLPDVTTPITITGKGAANTVVQASDCNPITLKDSSNADCTRATYSIIQVTPTGNLTLDGVTMQNGACAAGSCPYGTTNDAGAVYDDGTLTIKNSVVSNNYGQANGGAILSSYTSTLTVMNSTFSNNSADYGGAIDARGSVTITDSTFSGNQSNSGGGAIGYDGGSPGDTLTITNSTFTNNLDTIYGGGAIINYGDLIVVNSTFSGNSSAGASGMGGAILEDGGTSLTMINSTISGNTAARGGGVYLNTGSGPFNLKNTILANSANAVEDCYNVAGDTIATNTNSLIQTNGAVGHKCGTPAVTGDPLLSALANNGGSTQNLALLAGSPTIEAGDNTICADANTVNNKDQRGITRPQGLTCDIGAYEYPLAASITAISITRAGVSPTSATAVDFNVTLSEYVTGVDTADFKLINSPLTGAYISNVSGSGSTYTVTVNTGAGNGTIRLDLPTNASIKHLGVALPVVAYSGPTYIVDKGTAPTVPVLKTPLTGALVTTAPTLTWNTSSEVMALVNPWSYEVNVAALDGYNHTFNTASGLENTSLSDWSAAPLSSNTTYTWKVRACNDTNQCSAWSLTRTFRTKLATPVLNLPANSDTLNNKRPTFEWDAAEGATGYTVQVLKKSPATGLFTVISNTFTVTGATYAYTPTVDLLPGTLYAWKVKANGLNAGDYSALFTFTTSANPPKTPVKSLPVTGTSILSSANPALTWVAPLSAGLLAVPPTYYPLATGYDVQVSTNAGFANISPSNNVKRLNVGTTSTFLATVLAEGTAPDAVIRPGRTYYWRVRSISAAGNYSAWSAARTILVKFVAPTLVAPADLATGVSRTAPTFTWNSGDNGLWTSYTIQLATTPPTATTFAVVKSFTLIMAPKQTYTAALTPLTQLLSNKTYYWRVQINGLYTPIFSTQNFLTAYRFTTAP